MLEDLALELAQLRPRIEAKLLDQPVPRRLKVRERFGLPACPIESTRQLAQQSLAKRMLRDERLQLGDELPAPAKRKIGVDPIFERDQPPLLQPLRFDCCERLVEYVGQRGAPPERERASQRRRCLGRIAARQLLPATPKELLETVEVELVRLKLEHVARGTPSQPCASKHLSEARHVVVEGMRRARRRPLPPEAVD